MEEAILAFQQQLHGPTPKGQVVAVDGKEPKHSRGQHLLTAVVVPSQYYLGSAPVDEKTNEIPVARELMRRLDLEGCLVGLDALHTQEDTARDPKRKWTTITDFYTATSVGSHRRGMLLVTARQPSLKPVLVNKS